MNIDDYQMFASTTAKYPKESGLIYTVLGMASEAGEVAGKLKKAIRDEAGEITPERKAVLLAELGDVLWYVAMVATELETDLSTVAEMNLDKLIDRNTRGVIGGDGDTR
jgi:NTP pyrophosphatase (non-canonical NTP hydrolase)